jgi:hypothetical protein
MLYTIVLPIRKEGIESFFALNMPLYEKYLIGSEIKRFIFVTPSDSVDLLKSYCSKLTFDSEVVADEMFIDQSLLSERGWYKQQLIKLLVSEIVDTDHYLLIDDDLFLTQPLNYSDMVVEGKIVYSNESWTDDGPNFATNSRWWTGSCNLLDYNVANIVNSSTNMGVTPQLMITSEVQGMISLLSSRYGDIWKKKFIDCGATEYASYWVYLLKMEKSGFYTSNGKKMFVMNHARNILVPGLSPSQVELVVSQAFADKSEFFFVVQSWIGYPKHWYAHIIKNHINRGQ